MIAATQAGRFRSLLCLGAAIVFLCMPVSEARTRKIDGTVIRDLYYGEGWTLGLQTKYRLISGSYGKYHGEMVFEYEESVRGSKDISQHEMHSLRVIHFLMWSLSNLGIARSLLHFLNVEHDRNPVDVMLALASPGKNPDLDVYLEEFDREAREEWFYGP